MKTIIICEAGVNHNGDLNTAINLIRCASDAGADYIKFQTFNTNLIVSDKAQKAKYQLEFDENDNQSKMLKNLEIPEYWYPKLIDECSKNNIKFLSTGFDKKSIDLLEKFNMDFYKIPSGEITNLPHLRYVAKKGKPVILSTGLSNIEEVKQAVVTLKNNDINDEKIVLLHCTSEYPCPMGDVNLNAIKTLINEFNLIVGYSDHTSGIEVPIAAVALGARVIEKHITLDKKSIGPDHKASIEPNELKKMIKSIRNIETALGDGVKKPSKSELKNIHMIRRSIHLKENKLIGDIIKETDLLMLRPGDGISPSDIDKVIGKKVIKPIKKGDKLDFKNLL